jgi:hypothetical protein
MLAMILDPAISMLLVFCAALLFASAAAHKLRDLQRFAEIFAAYGLGPASTGLGIAWMVPTFEIVVAAGMVIEVSRPYAAALGIAMLSGYAVAIAVNLRRGRRDLACGCGGRDAQRPIAAWMVWRNILIALSMALASLPRSDRVLDATDGITVGFGMLTIALVYLCIDQLLSNAQRGSRLRGAR